MKYTLSEELKAEIRGRILSLQQDIKRMKILEKLAKDLNHSDIDFIPTLQRLEEEIEEAKEDLK